MEILSNQYLIIGVCSLLLLIGFSFVFGDYHFDLELLDISIVAVLYMISFTSFTLLTFEPIVSNEFVLLIIGLIASVIAYKTKKYIFKTIYNTKSGSVTDLKNLINKTGIVQIANKELNQYEIYVEEVKNSFIVKSYDHLEKNDEVILLDIEDGVIIVTKVK